MPPLKSAPTTVMIVDDHPAVRDAVALAVAAQHDMALAGVAGSAAEAFDLLRRARPDVAVVDIALGDAHGLDLVQSLRAEHPNLQVVVFSMYDEAVYAERALRAGALGYVRKSEPTSAVTEAIRAAAVGEIYLARRAASRLLARIARGDGARDATRGHGSREGTVGVALCDGDQGADGVSRSGGPQGGVGLAALTDREMAVFQLIGQGHVTDEIAERLNLSRKTVETYRRRSKEKLELESVSELLQVAIRWTLTQESGD